MSLDGDRRYPKQRDQMKKLILHAKVQKSWEDGEHWYCTGHLDWSVKSVMRDNLVLKAQYKCNFLIKNSPRMCTQSCVC